ncbi:MAG: class I SAM-dependent methyltransferase [Xanthomonadaceae bacterium]|nr:cyclopropane-fatty-acyl-phospholipid synthase family protein [Xanthomonadaceae bacterium]MDE1885730.1 class I SAM-dependent methyltransferase [Xanthomonadaceae bacterium]MDE1960500.1 class I SAM-dependent methyltransferase [Xanthomonadaceae bacterium]MDE2084042.1 class I SAM-dependent methyltransferase [Xanthomonadaceae bacterium]MDE2256966.1 class I SAM-dependent methyltransferase [Xanthomonadaceae bacterium]
MNDSVIATAAAVDAPRGLTGLAERGLLPDWMIRAGIRRLCAQRLHAQGAGDAVAAWTRFQSCLDELRESPVAIHTDAANAQHYELPPRFFELCLGTRLKYSSCYFPTGNETLDQAEQAMLALYGERAQLADGQDVLELGCGWGSLTLWMAQNYPRSRITAVSNSRPQREFILARCRALGVTNVEVITQDVNRLQLESARFDRCVSIEMFEHMRNYATLLAHIATWLRAGGKLFVHIFCHRELMYPFETDGDDNWMGRHFFTGGLMPSADTLLWFQRDLTIEQQWRLSGTHYARTANAWLANQDKNRATVLEVLEQAYGEQARVWHQRWRMFWMACAELFGYRGGNEWLVAHYRFAKH